MIIRAKDKNINAVNILGETIRQNGKSYPALRFMFDGGVTETELNALCSGMFEILDDAGNVVGTHEGYTTKGEHTFVVGKITTAEQDVVSLEKEITAVREEHTTYKGMVQTILPTLDDETAVSVKKLFPKWEVDTEYITGKRLLYGDMLYKVKQDHTSQADWVPSGTSALYEVINETNEGTVEDPIPYTGNMTLENGKYYTQDGIVYLCNRDTGNPVHNALSELVGLYVETI